MTQTVRPSRGVRKSGQQSAPSRSKQSIEPVEVLADEVPPAPAQPHRATRDHKTCWSNRFHRATAEQLLSDLNSATRKQVEHARSNLTKYAAENIEWLGTWHWAFVYRTPKCNGVAHAYIIADPARPRLCVPTDDEALLESPTRIHRTLKDALLRAPVVETVRWTVWDIQSKEQVDAILAFAREFAFANA